MSYRKQQIGFKIVVRDWPTILKDIKWIFFQNFSLRAKTKIQGVPLQSQIRIKFKTPHEIKENKLQMSISNQRNILVEKACYSIEEFLEVYSTNIVTKLDCFQQAHFKDPESNNVSKITFDSLWQVYRR